MSLDSDIPLCVDMDGTLTERDVLVVGLLSLLIKNPLSIFPLCLALLGGKAKFKYRAGQMIVIDPKRLVFNHRLIDFLVSEKERGRHPILVTGNDRRIAEAVAAHVGVFSEVIASEENCNLVGKTKAEALIKRFGTARFDYVGNSYKDVPVWKHARKAYIVTDDNNLIRKVAALGNVDRIFSWKIYV